MENYLGCCKPFEHLPDAVLFLDPAGVITACNRRVAGISGYAPEELVGRNFASLGLIAPDSLELAVSLFVKLMAGEEIGPVELIIINKNGRRLVVEANPRVITRDGRPDELEVSLRDLSQRREAELRLRVEKAYWEQLFESSPEAVAVVGNDGNIIRVNGEFTRMFGYTPEEAVGQSIDQLLAPGELFEEALSLTRTSYGRRVSTEAIRYRKDGSPVDVSILGAPIDAGEGQIAIYGIYRDITERKRAEELGRNRTDFLSRLVGLSDAAELAQLTFDHISNQMPIDAGVIVVKNGLVSGGGYEAVFSFDTDENGIRAVGKEREHFDIGKETFTAGVLRSGTELIIHRTDEEYARAVPNAAELKVLNQRKSRSLVFLPLKVHGQTFGVLSVQSYQVDIFNPSRVAILESVVADLALAITAVRMTEALRESEERYRVVAEQTGQIIYDYDVESGRIAWSGAIAAITGYSTEEFQRVDIDGWAELVHPEDRPGALAALDNALKGCSRYNVEYRMRCKDESYIFVEDNGVFLGDYAGRAVRMLGTMSDVSEHRRAKELLVRSEEKYRRLIETMPTGLIISDMQGQTLFANPAACDIFGYTLEEILGMNATQFLPPESLQIVQREIDRRLRGELGEYEVAIRRKDGEFRTIGVNGAPLYDNEGKVVGTSAIFSDITESKKAEAEKLELRDKLARAQRMESLGVLAGGVAHDLNNILGPLVAYPELIRLKLAPESPIAKQITKIESSAQRAAEVVQDLLTMARRGRYEMSALNLNKVIEGYLQSADFHELCSRFPLIEVFCNLGLKAKPINGSTPHLYKVVLNLVLNAMDAMPNGGRLAIKTETRHVDRLAGGYDNIERGLYTILTVSDNGIGIDPKDYRRIFEPFYTKKEMGRSGSGLGLAIVYGVVKDHNGYIDVRSEPEKGSDFILYFPATEHRAEVEGLACLDIRGRESILVVDDVVEQRELAATVLGSLGYRVHTSENGHAAVDFLTRNTVDVVILDMIMEPGFDGLDTYREIIKLYPGQRAIITSGYSETDRVREAERLGVGQYIRKPYTMQKLGKAIREILVRQALATPAI